MKVPEFVESCCNVSYHQQVHSGRLFEIACELLYLVMSHYSGHTINCVACESVRNLSYHCRFCIRMDIPLELVLIGFLYFIFCMGFFFLRYIICLHFLSSWDLILKRLVIFVGVAAHKLWCQLCN